MENNLDKYFREQLSDRKFEPKEAYWLGAKALLEADERRRKRRVFFWWFSGSIGLLALLALAWWSFGKTTTAKPLAHEKASQMTVEKGSKTSTIKPNISAVIAPGENKNSAASGNAPISESLVGTESKSQQPIPRSIKKYHKEANINSTRSLFLNNTSTDSPAVDQHILQGEHPSVQPVAQPKSDAAPSSKEEIIAEMPNGQATPTLLPILEVLVVGKFDENELQTRPIADKIDVVNKEKWQFSILTAGIFRPKIQQDAKTLLGLRTGLNVQFNLHGGWHLSTGLNYQYRTGSFSDAQSAVQRNYRFGLELDTLLLRPTNLHYLSLPLLVGYEYKKHQYQAGVSLDYLMGARGEIGTYQKQGEPPVKRFTPEQTGWVSTAGYRTWVPVAQLNYQYALSKRWAIGLSAYYSIGGLLDKNYTPPFGSFLLKEKDKLNLGLHLAYRFN